MKYDFGFRLDIGNKIGSGHFYRCLAIAKELKKNNKKVIFIVNDKSNLLVHPSEKIPYVILQGKNEKDKINECKELLQNIKNLIIDLPTQNEIYSKNLKNYNTILFDDLGRKSVYSKFVFNGQIVKMFHKYSKSQKNISLFLGPKYLILRNGFLKQRSKVSLRKNNIKKILLTFGGGDYNNYSRKILKGLLEKNYNLTIILGPTFSDKVNFKKFFADYPNLTIKSNVKNPEKLFYTQDIVICTVGITVYELACLGIPSIMISFTKKQMQVANKLSRLGYGKNYGYWDNDFNKLDSMISVLNNYKLRKIMYKNGRCIIDGKGVQRISKKLLQLL
jgi:UDP-2,4-diacetamido-2,4,6-trideoxy-beta-L-altropyranose hydrolase